MWDFYLHEKTIIKLMWLSWFKIIWINSKFDCMFDCMKDKQANKMIEEDIQKEE